MDTPERQLEGNLEGHNLSKVGFGQSNKQLLNYVTVPAPTSAGDYTTATEHDFTDWSVQSLTSKTAVKVHLRVYFLDDTAGSYVQIRKNGSSDTAMETVAVETTVANIAARADVMVDLDSSQVLEIKTNDAGGGGPVTNCWLSVIGWFEPAHR